MKKVILILCFFAVVFQAEVYSQSRAVQRAASNSFSDAEREYRRGDYNSAAMNYEIVLRTIPITSDSRRNVTMRLDATVALVKIYMDELTNFDKACQHLETFSSDLNYIKQEDVLRGRQLYNYLQLANELDEYKRNCSSFKNIESGKDAFEKRFEKEFED